MHFEQFYLGCLAHASYMLVSGGEAVVVDPQRDVDIYLQAAKQHKATIRHVFETHLHADFVSGHRELAERTGAAIYIGPNSGATVPHVEVREGFELRVGTIKIAILETPGHTPESVCLLVTDEEKSPEPSAVLTGDTLFVGDVGRPDLSKASAPGAGWNAVRLPAHQTAHPARCGDRVSRTRSRFAVRTQSGNVPILDDRQREADELCTPDQNA